MGLHDDLADDLAAVLSRHRNELDNADRYTQMHDLLLWFLDEQRWHHGDVIGDTVVLDDNVLRFIDYLLDRMEAE